MRAPFPRRRPAVLGAVVVPLVAAALVATSLSAPGARAASPGPSSQAADPDITLPEQAADPVDGAAEEAVDALQTVRAVLSGAGIGSGGPEDGDRRQSEPAPEPPTALPDLEDAEPTMALRELALLRDALPRSLRAEADAYLARPTDDGRDGPDDYTTDEVESSCSRVVCVHYVTETRDRPRLRDEKGRDGVPDYVDRARNDLTHVHNTYVGAGYRRPKRDNGRGGDNKVDVYLADIGDDGYYGYCTTDRRVPERSSSVPGYCVLDDDYRPGQFPANTPRQNFRVTAAHEYFHAVQFGYDIGEDRWLMEATATWAEDELYDGIDDNRQYLRYGPMKRPAMPLDTYSGFFHYGSWIWFRHLTERRPRSQGGMPTLVRDIWRRLDDAPGGRDEYSMEAVTRVLAQRDYHLTRAFEQFAAANRTPGRSYEEGKAYPRAGLAANFRLTRGDRRATFRREMDHLSAATVRYQPRRGLRQGTWVLRLDVNMIRRWRGSGAVLTIKKRGQAPYQRRVDLNRYGNGNIGAKFTRGEVKWVELTLVNASDNYRCRVGGNFSCEGRSKDDNALARVNARVKRRR